jgi:hypothetical protein
MEFCSSIPPRSLDKALDFVRKGGRLCVRTSLRTTTIDSRVLARFGKANAWLLKEEGDGYRLQSGNSSVYLMPGQLEAINVKADEANSAPLPAAQSRPTQRAKI